MNRLKFSIPVAASQKPFRFLAASLFLCLTAIVFGLTERFRHSAACVRRGMTRQWIACFCCVTLTVPSGTMAGVISAWAATDASPANRDQEPLPIWAAISCILAFLPALL